MSRRNIKAVQPLKKRRMVARAKSKKLREKLLTQPDANLRTSGLYGRFTYTDGQGQGPEKKFKDTTVTNAVIANGHEIKSPSLLLITAGNGANTRIGRQICHRRRGRCQWMLRDQHHPSCKGHYQDESTRPNSTYC